jgi:predicted nucleotidyltransferase
MPTALELKREEWQRFKGIPSDGFEPRELTPEEQQKMDRLIARVRELAKILKNRYGAKKVILFGSLAGISRFTAASDVDLGVEGLKAKKYWQAWKLAEEYIGDRRVDVVDIETATESLKKAIYRYGIEL